MCSDSSPREPSASVCSRSDESSAITALRVSLLHGCSAVVPQTGPSNASTNACTHQSAQKVLPRRSAADCTDCSACMSLVLTVIVMRAAPSLIVTPFTVCCAHTLQHTQTAIYALGYWHQIRYCSDTGILATVQTLVCSLLPLPARHLHSGRCFESRFRKPVAATQPSSWARNPPADVKSPTRSCPTCSACPYRWSPACPATKPSALNPFQSARPHPLTPSITSVALHTPVWQCGSR